MSFCLFEIALTTARTDVFASCIQLIALHVKELCPCFERLETSLTNDRRVITLSRKINMFNVGHGEQKLCPKFCDQFILAQIGALQP